MGSLAGYYGWKQLVWRSWIRLGLWQWKRGAQFFVLFHFFQFKLAPRLLFAPDEKILQVPLFDPKCDCTSLLSVYPSLGASWDTVHNLRSSVSTELLETCEGIAQLNALVYCGACAVIIMFWIDGYCASVSSRQLANAVLLKDQTLWISSYKGFWALNSMASILESAVPSQTKVPLQSGTAVNSFHLRALTIIDPGYAVPCVIKVRPLPIAW